MERYPALISVKPIAFFKCSQALLKGSFLGTPFPTQKVTN
ncbi:hypothetical protein CHCC15337_2859 [Bacillus paralicheniformis]|nr:hypothetical protein CHCC5021_1889 [Bacillus paralicheniformis]TWK44529.1 hypothetical protein CHCC20348_2156 [Bacillus paralicheniformis]TWK48465.1 hypothetical protein CHCC20347_0915 [Bacillus paralicheniformis]TWL09335.1 hypothetical protein CHCC19468_1546 [Bacillus paralicheniformis]TWL19422.1 hypothetical protein CHCC19467_4119 [Bacillus paralicheniformis]